MIDTDSNYEENFRRYVCELCRRSDVKLFRPACIPFSDTKFLCSLHLTYRITAAPGVYELRLLETSMFPNFQNALFLPCVPRFDQDQESDLDDITDIWYHRNCPKEAMDWWLALPF